MIEEIPELYGIRNFGDYAIFGKGTSLTRETAAEVIRQVKSYGEIQKRWPKLIECLEQAVKEQEK